MKFAMGLLGKPFMLFRKSLIYKNQFITDIFITCYHSKGDKSISPWKPGLFI